MLISSAFENRKSVLAGDKKGIIKPGDKSGRIEIPLTITAAINRPDYQCYTNRIMYHCYMKRTIRHCSTAYLPSERSRFLCFPFLWCLCYCAFYGGVQESKNKGEIKDLHTKKHCRGVKFVWGFMSHLRIFSHIWRRYYRR